MIAAWPYLLLLPLLAMLMRDDFRTRQVAIVWLVVLGMGCVLVGWMTASLRPMLLHTVVNTALLLLFGGAMIGWQLVRRKPLREFFANSFGVGDVVMMWILTPLFCPVTYVRFLLISCAISLMWWTLHRSKTIPLAGVMAFTLAGYALCKTVGLWS